jgi:hypothetical protein
VIYNRTQSDIDAALIARKKIQNGEQLTESDMDSLERGTITINTLNRIEEKQSELIALFNSIGYWNIRGIQNRTWDYTDYFKQEDFDRILKNLDILKVAYYVYYDTPIVSDSNYRRFQTVNQVERVLSDMERMIGDMVQNYRICGEVSCSSV